VVKLLHSAETPTAVYVAVEKVRPLGKVLAEMHKATQHQREEWIGWGLSRLVHALKFLNAEMGVTHGNVRCDSIFLSTSGEWRLGGFELMSKPGDDSGESTLYTLGGMVPDAARYAAPEIKQQGWGVLRDLAVHVADSYALGLVILESYNGTLPPRGPSDVAVPARGRVPEVLYGHVKRMMLPNARSRLTMKALAEAGFQAPGGFFTENRLCKVAAGLDGFILSSEEQRSEVLRTIKTASKSFPPDFLQYKVLPVLVQALTIGNGGIVPTREMASTNGAMASNGGSSLGQYTSPSLQASRLLPLILQLGEPLNNEDWGKSVAQVILKAFTSADRAVRMALLESLPTFVDRFETKQVSDRIWPNLLTGFGDSSATIREATVRAIVPIATKLTDRILNNDMLRQLARTQVDVEPRIRTNTTVLLGTLAPKLSAATRKNVLIPAFTRSLKDTFAHARMAGLMAFTATIESFDGVDCARSIVPALCPCLLDADTAIRKQAKESVALFLTKIHNAASAMPVTESDVSTQSLYEPQETQRPESHDYDTPQNAVSSAGDAASALAQLGPPSTVRSFGQGLEQDMHDDMTPAYTDVQPVWAEMGDLMDVMDDNDDWSNFAVASNRTESKKAASQSNNAAKASARADTGRSVNSPTQTNASTSVSMPSAASKVKVVSQRGASTREKAKVPPAGSARTAMAKTTLAVHNAEEDEENDAWGW
jgi:SCY1-like protein 1